MGDTWTRRWRRGLLALAAFSLVLAGCAGDEGGTTGEGTGMSGDGSTATDTGDGSPAAAGGEADPEGVLRVALNLVRAGSANLDPRFMNSSNHGEFLNQIYSTLAEYDPQTGEYSANLAEFEVIDPQTMRFTIREGATFHDGSPVTAEDAKASIELTRANSVDGSNNANAGIQLVESVEVEDERTFVVATAEPGLATLFELMVGPEFMISPADAGAEQSSNPVGNGQFRVVDYVQDERIVLEKWEDHWAADEVQLAGMEFVQLEPGNTQQNALLAGDIDYATELNLAAVETLEGREGFTGLALPDATNYIFFDPCKADGSPWGSLELRQAFMKGMDREVLNQAVYGGYATMTAAMWPPGHPYYDESIDQVHAHDPEAAAELILQAGLSGEPLGVYATSAIAESQDLVLTLNQQLSDLGLSLEPVATDDVVADFMAPSLENPASLNHHAMINLQTRPGMQKLTRQFVLGQISNICNYENERMTEIIAELQALAPDDPQAAELWVEAQMFNAEQGLYPTFGFYPAFSGYADRVGGVDTDTFNAYTAGGIPFEDMYIQQQ